MQFALLLLLATASWLAAHANAQQPTESSAPNFWFAHAPASSAVNVSVGDNVTFVCRYETDNRWSVKILRWHPNAALRGVMGRAFSALAVDNRLDKTFELLASQFPEFRNRLSMRFDTASKTVFFTISNFQYADAGDFGCVATTYMKVSQYSNLTVSVTGKLYVYLYCSLNDQPTHCFTLILFPLNFLVFLFHFRRIITCVYCNSATILTTRISLYVNFNRIDLRKFQPEFHFT